jgi:hypothetical protein
MIKSNKINFGKLPALEHNGKIIEQRFVATACKVLGVEGLAGAGVQAVSRGCWDSKQTEEHTAWFVSTT